MVVKTKLCRQWLAATIVRVGPPSDIVTSKGLFDSLKSLTKLGDLFKNIGTGWMGKKNQEEDVAEEDTKTPGGDSLGFASSFGAMVAGGGSLEELIENKSN